MTDFPDQIETNPLARELAELIRLEECNKQPDNELEGVSDYEVYAAFIGLLTQYPSILLQVLEGQQKARELKTYKPDAGILAFETTGHAHFLREALQCIKALMQIQLYSQGHNVYVNPIGLRIFMFNINRAYQQEQATDDMIWESLAEMLDVSDETLENIRQYLERDQILGSKQDTTGKVARQEAQRARYEA